MNDIVNAWVNAVIDIINTPVLGGVFLVGFWLIIDICIIRLCINIGRCGEHKEIDRKAQLQTKIKAVHMIPNATNEDKVQLIADLYEQYLKEEKNHERR